MRILPSLLALLALACGDKSDGGSGAGSASNDADGDGYAATVDCDDTSAAIHPGAEDAFDGLDNDCSGTADDGAGSTLYYADSDGDGFGDEGSTVEACALPEGYVEDATDCDDNAAAVNPDATELCNEVDDDCDEAADEEPEDGIPLYADTDDDGYGDPDTETLGCAPGEGLVEDDTDCDDDEPMAFPGNDEICDGLDNDCDGDGDDADADVVGQSTWYSDRDGDGYGDDTHSTVSCEAPLDYAADDGDCDDFEPDAFPGNTEVCDEIDNDCDGSTDPSTAVDALPWYTDADGDSYGDPSTLALACEATADQVADDTDCDDTNDESHPGAMEVCDGADNDCDAATVDEGIATFWDSAGVVSDYTATMSGTSSSPATVTLADDGELWICPGTWYTTLTVEANVSIEGLGTAADVVLDGAGGGSVLFIDMDNLTVSASNLTLQGGTGSISSASSFYRGGGALCVGDNSSLSLDGVIITDNEAEYGGGIRAHGCDLQMNSSVVSLNSATDDGGGIYSTDNTTTIDASSISGNSATYHGGGIYSEFSTMTLDGSSISGNNATYAGGGIFSDDSYITCTGSISAAEGILSNTADYGGGVYLYSYYDTFTATDCDLGTAAGADDNDPQDIYVSSGYNHYLYGNDQSFTCSGSRCGTTSTTTVGTGVSNFAGLTTKARGNIFTATADTTVESFEVYVDPDSGCGTYYWYVLSASSPTASTWTVEDSGTESTSTTSAGFISMSPVGVPIESGTTYALVYAWPSTCSLAYYYEQGASSYDAGIGTISGYHWSDSNFSSANYSGATVSAKVYSSTVAFYMKINSSH